jgi:hypothetical protein
MYDDRERMVVAVNFNTDVGDSLAALSYPLETTYMDCARAFT